MFSLLLDHPKLWNSLLLSNCTTPPLAKGGLRNSMLLLIAKVLCAPISKMSRRQVLTQPLPQQEIFPPMRRAVRARMEKPGLGRAALLSQLTRGLKGSFFSMSSSIEDKESISKSMLLILPRACPFHHGGERKSTC